MSAFPWLLYLLKLAHSGASAVHEGDVGIQDHRDVGTSDVLSYLAVPEQGIE